MACSCKAKSPLLSTKKAIAQFYNTDNKRVVSKTVDIKTQQPEVKYDFSADTKPTQYCKNCIQKHISMAIAMIQYGSVFNRLVAAGQLLLASQHYATADIKLRDICYYTAVQIIQKHATLQEVLPKLNDLLAYTVYKNDINKHKVPKQYEKPSITKATETWSYKAACIAQLCSVYCMLFTQIGYQQINKAFTVGKLGLLATQYTASGQITIASKLRQQWKKIQEIRPYDTIYKEVRKDLQTIIQNLYNDFIKNPDYIKE